MAWFRIRNPSMSSARWSQRNPDKLLLFECAFIYQLYVLNFICFLTNVPFSLIILHSLDLSFLFIYRLCQILYFLLQVWHFIQLIVWDWLSLLWCHSGFKLLQVWVKVWYGIIGFVFDHGDHNELHDIFGVLIHIYNFNIYL